MASYTKQMIDVAKTWLDVNTDPLSPFLRFPRVTDRMERPDHDAALRRVERKLAKYPELRANAEIMEQIENVRRVTSQSHEAFRELEEMESTVERALNRELETKHQKFGDGGPSQAYLGRWCLAWARHGYNTMEVTPDFAAAMLLTDARELDVADVRMPFRGILFLIPDGFARGREGGHYTKVHITEIPRTDAALLSAIGKMTDAMVDLPPEARARVMDQAKSGLAISEKMIASAPMLANATSKLELRSASQPAGAEIKLLHIYATDGVHALSTIIDRQGLTWDAFEELESDVGFTADIEAMRAVRQIVFGALAYATAIPTAITAAPENARGPRRASSDPSPKRWEVGRTIRIDHNLVQSVRAGSREVLYRLKHRHIVRGHYRNQAHGAGRLERKIMWISPHWKGPEDGAALVHTYKLATDQGDQGNRE